MERLRVYFLIFFSVLLVGLILGSVCSGTLMIAYWDVFVRVTVAIGTLFFTVMGIAFYEETV